ncbi:MAG: transporter [Verrucomicrobiota bacterium]|jgi:hypothetical protein|nr:transporter [Verrucomicrobiota bacterium]
MNLRKVVWMAVACSVVAGAAWADPMRTIFTKENKFPEAMRGEIEVGGLYDDMKNPDSVDDGWAYGLMPTVRFGLAEGFAVKLGVPFVGYDDGINKENGVGDILVGAELRIFQDIFDYAWIIPYVNVICPSGNEDKGLGRGETQAHFGVSIGTTVNDVLHFAADASYAVNGSNAKADDDVAFGSLSLVWDLDERASLLGEIQLRDDPVDPDDDYVVRGHGGFAFRLNDMFTLAAYVGSSTEERSDYYAAGRLIFSF